MSPGFMRGVASAATFQPRFRESSSASNVASSSKAASRATTRVRSVSLKRSFSGFATTGRGSRAGKGGSFAGSGAAAPATLKASPQRRRDDPRIPGI